MNNQNKSKISKICVNLLISVVVFVTMYCVNYGISWINNLSYTDMLYTTLPFLFLSICTLATFGFVADCIEEKKQREIRKKKRVSVIKRAYKNRNKIILVRSTPKYEIFS